jgi:catechol O-methyltransferase
MSASSFDTFSQSLSPIVPPPPPPSPIQLTKEERLLEYVKANVAENDLLGCIAAIDKFCYDGNWMMNLGDKKGHYYTNELKKSGSKIGLELGTYVGYSALLSIEAMGEEGKMVCIDPNDTTNKIAIQIFNHAGVLDRILLLQGDLPSNIETLTENNYVFDHIFFDHFKSLYYRDLMILEETSLIKKGTLMFADNVVYFKIQDYLNRVNDDKYYYDQALHEDYLEYTKDTDKEKLIDGVHVAYWKGWTDKVEIKETNQMTNFLTNVKVFQFLNRVKEVLKKK